MSEQHPLFPIKLQVQWQKPSFYQLNDTLGDWLLEPGSLTARLKRHCDHFRVEVLGQKIITCPPEEANGEICTGDDVLVREVLLYCDDSPQVFARSLLPLTSLTGAEQQLAHLGNQPLGQVIFNNSDFERQAIEIASFSSQSTVGCFAQSMKLAHFSQLWGRRSLFYLQQKPLMVAEVFLPGAFAYRQEVVV